MLRRRELLAGAAVLGALAGCVTGPAAPAPAPLRRIGFASCIDQTQAPADLGHGAGRPARPLHLRRRQRLSASCRIRWRGFAQAYAWRRRRIRGMSGCGAAVPHLAIWDDHDYGAERRRRRVPLQGRVARRSSSISGRSRPTIRGARARGCTTRRSSARPASACRCILLDTRWFRSPWKRTDQRDAPGKERYLPDADPGQDHAGRGAVALARGAGCASPREVRLIVSGIQVVAEGHGWERWGNFPRERERLYRLIAQTRARRRRVPVGRPPHRRAVPRGERRAVSALRDDVQRRHAPLAPARPKPGPTGWASFSPNCITAWWRSTGTRGHCGSRSRTSRVPCSAAGTIAFNELKART